MKKRHPQEIADFFQCYVAQDGTGHFQMYSEKPTFIMEDQDFGVENVWCMVGKPQGRTEYITSFVDIPEDHDFHTLYEPSKPKDKAPHQSDVHLGDRYVLLGEFQPSDLMRNVEQHLNMGFKLYGNPFVGPDTSYGYIHYQAMVRGL